MKIGILTLPFNNNYGGYLQTYALMTVLKSLGHSPELIYRKHNRRPLIWRIERIAKNLIKLLLGKTTYIIPNQERELRKKGALMMPFVDKYIIPRTKPLYSTKELRMFTAKRYDAVIVGSDQVWRPDYVPGIVENFFLTFLPQNVKRISYAASFGTFKPIYSDKQRQECGKGFDKFDVVTVREESALDVIKDFGWKCRKSPVQVLDPTMLLPKDYYQTIVLHEASAVNGKILTYILDPGSYTDKLIKEVCDCCKLEVVDFLDKDNWKKSDSVLPSIESWLSAFRDAAFVVTDSFHGTVFSIIFNKPFVAITNTGRGTDRFESLLSQFNLTDCLYSEGKRYCHAEINWQKVNNILEKKKSESISILKMSL